MVTKKSTGVAGLAVLLAALAGISGCSSEVEPEVQEAAAALPADAAAPSASIARRPSAENAAVRFVTPAHGDVVSNPVRVEFVVSGMELVPAGKDEANSGHHHLLIDTGLPDPNLPIPADANHLHFGDGSSSTDLTLSPGEHTLQLLFADFLHVPHEAPVHSDRITVTVR